MKPHEINQAIAEHLGWTGPDYYNDLNAMHNVEKTLSFDQCQEYSAILITMTDDCEYHATAAQKAEAYLRVKRLWVEGGAK